MAPVLRTLGLLKKDRLCKDYIDDNVSVFYPRCLYIPVFFTRGLVLDNRPKVVMNAIVEHRIDFDVIHAHFSWPSAFIAYRLKNRFNVEYFLTIHENSDWLQTELDIQCLPLVKGWSNAQKVFRVNQRDVPVLRKYNPNTYKMDNCVSNRFRRASKAKAREELGIPNEKKVIFSLGNLMKRKGFTFLIDAMAPFIERDEDPVCFIGGSGPERRSLKKRIDRNKLGESVKLIGRIDPEMINTWMNACDIFVLPSLSESFGVVLIEAMTCGKPVVATYNGGSEEVVVSEELGLLANPGDPLDLHLKLQLALEKDWDGDTIESWAKRYSAENVMSELLVYYEEATSDNM